MIVENLETSEASEDEESLNLSSFYKRNTRVQKNCAASQKWKNELDLYLSQPCVTDVNILFYYFDNIYFIYIYYKYLFIFNFIFKLFPKLSSMARDLFSIQATSVPAERLFSRGSLTIRKHRNKLNNESIKYLMCINSWTTCSLKTKIQSLLDH